MYWLTWHFTLLFLQRKFWNLRLWPCLSPIRFSVLLHCPFPSSWLCPHLVQLTGFCSLPQGKQWEFLKENYCLTGFSRLFYAGACNGQMPEILTMIQAQRMTPAPSVLAMVRIKFYCWVIKIKVTFLQALLSMLYLTVSDIDALINYVGFATWVSWHKNLEL